jgi:hypothetical protein
LKYLYAKLCKVDFQDDKQLIHMAANLAFKA